MIKKLSGAEFCSHASKYYGVKISRKQGKSEALMVIRKKLALGDVSGREACCFNWDEVHEIAEQLERIQLAVAHPEAGRVSGASPKSDYGEPIPDKNGKISRALALCRSTDRRCQAIRGIDQCR